MRIFVLQSEVPGGYESCPLYTTLGVYSTYIGALGEAQFCENLRIELRGLLVQQKEFIFVRPTKLEDYTKNQKWFKDGVDKTDEYKNIETRLREIGKVVHDGWTVFNILEFELDISLLQRMEQTVLYSELPLSIIEDVFHTYE